MRSMKKIFALALVVMMLFAFAVVTASAKDEVDYTEAANRLASINVLKGDTNGNLMLDQGVTRYQAALFFVQSLTGVTDVEKWNAEKQSSVFSDVPEYATAIDYAYGINLIKGRGEGIYGYNDPITYQDMLVLAVRALGYEGENTVYPRGYIEIAKKLELMDGVDEDVEFTDPLTRGATAQIIWNMLETYIAIEDPLTGDIIYPNDFAALERLLALIDVPLERKILLEEAGFSHGVLEAVIVEYDEAEMSKDITTVTLDNGMEIAAADLGITPRTQLDTFLGLPVTLYVDCSVADFERDYDVDKEQSEASIILYEFCEFVNVVNAGDAGKIKVVDNDNYYRLTLGDATYRSDKYIIDFRVFDEDGWVEEDFDVFVDAFLYDSDDGYVGTNSYGEIDYTIYTKEIDDEDENVLLILYKPYEFGQYFTRTIRYQPMVSDESFITIGKYDPDAIDNEYENFAGQDTYFVETLLGSDNCVIDENTDSVSKRDGEAAREAKLSGESVRSGDFIFYYYNEYDNILEVGYNCGGLQKGELKSHNRVKETIKIDSTTYEFGFAGAFEHDLPVYEDYDFTDDYISKLGEEDHNAQYVAADGKVVYLQTPLNLSGKRVKHNFAIITTEPETMAELLNMDVDDYEEALTDDGIYVSDKGNMTVAMLNTSNGKWALAEVAQYEYGTRESGTGLLNRGYDYDEAAFPYCVDVADGIEKYGVFGDGFKHYDRYVIARDALLQGGMFAIRANNGGVYDLSVMFTTGDYGMMDNGLNTDGLVFSDAAPKTNLIKATRSESKSSARVTLTDSTVIVIVDRDGTVAVRVGIQGADDSVKLDGASDSNPAFFYSATNKLIVLRLPLKSGVSLVDNEGNPVDLAEWGETGAADAAETYYVATNGSDIAYERLEDDTYDVTVSGIFNLKTMRAVSAIKVNVDDVDDTNLVSDFETGAILHMKPNGKLVIEDIELDEALLKATELRDEDEEFESIDMTEVEFIDDSSITIEELDLEAAVAVGAIDVTVATLDLTDLKVEDYDFERIAYDNGTEYDRENEWDAPGITFNEDDDVVYAYDIYNLGTSITIDEPSAGILNQYIIDTVGETLLIAENDSEYFEDSAEITVNLYACARFDDDDGRVIIYVLKVVTEG